MSANEGVARIDCWEVTHVEIKKRATIATRLFKSGLFIKELVLITLRFEGSLFSDANIVGLSFR